MRGGEYEDEEGLYYEGIGKGGAADPAAKRDIIKSLVKRVEVNDEEICIVYRINPSSSDPSRTMPFLQHCRSDA